MKSDIKTQSSPAIEERIRERAYHLWVEAGRPHGRDQEHWEKARSMIEQEERNPEPTAGARPATRRDAGAAIDPPVKTKTAAKKKPSLKAAKSPRHS